jgi:uncharacterized protein
MTTDDPTPEPTQPGSTPPSPPPPPAAAPPPPPPPPPAAPQPPSAPPPQAAYSQPSGLAQPTMPGFPPAREGDETTWALLAHLSIFVLGLIGPLLIMLIGGEKRPFARAHAVEALNFHITLIGADIIGFILMFIFFAIFWPLGLLLLLALIAIWIGAIIFAIMGAIKASSGEGFRYPLTLRLVS